jgi:hypothetical protein
MANDPRASVEECGGRRSIAFYRLDTLAPDFLNLFATYRASFLDVLSNSYEDYFGDAYHLDRMLAGDSILYFAVSESEVVAASYVKRNRRRGGTAVRPGRWRRVGLAGALVRASFADFSDQYSIVSTRNVAMVGLLLRTGFRRANALEHVRHATGADFSSLSNFLDSADGLTFTRQSGKRGAAREQLALFRHLPNETT